MKTMSYPKRLLILLYGSISYALAMIAILYMIAFLAGFDVPHHTGFDAAPGTGIALLDNIGLILLFGLQHSIMARLPFKRWLHQQLPAQAERSTYVLAAAIVLSALFYFWQPIPQVIWSVEDGLASGIIQGLYWFGIGLAIVSTFVINHFDLFGIRQAVLAWRERQYAEPNFQTPLLYRIVRHPMMTGLLIAFWATPHMTAGRLVFAIGMTVYVLIGIHYEERALLRSFGKYYADYRQRTPALVPGLKPAMNGSTSEQYVSQR